MKSVFANGPALRRWAAFSAIVLPCAAVLQAQPELVVRGANFFVAPGEDVFVGGDVHIQSSGQLSLEGQLRLTGDWTNNNPAVSPAIDPASTGVVNLFGNQQRILGTGITQFPSLRCTNLGSKDLQQHAEVRLNLELNQAQMNTTGFELRLLNPAVGSLQYSTGHVASSLADGRFVRATTSAGLYVFPVGEALGAGTSRVRPVEIQPAATPTQYGVRFVPDPSAATPSRNDDKDATVCVVSEYYYHTITPQDPSLPAQIDILYEPTDAPYNDSLAYWDAPQSQWSRVGQQLNLGDRVRFDETAFTGQPDDHFAFAIPAPNFNLVFAPLPPEPISIGDSVLFTADPPNANYLYSWNFGDGQNGFGNPVVHQFSESGEYPVSVLASIPGTDCILKQQEVITILNLLDLRFPSAFSPNADQGNDAFEVFYSGLNEPNLRIYNRWGNEVANLDFATGDRVLWDGTQNGTAVPEGVYVFVFSATRAATNQPVERRGTVTVLR